MPQIPELAAFTAAWKNSKADPESEAAQEQLFLSASTALIPVRKAAIEEMAAIRAGAEPTQVMLVCGGDEVGAFPWALILDVIMQIIRALIDGWDI